MMLLTEEEAKTKWCPMIRQAIIGDSVGVVFNSVHDSKDSTNTPSGNCIASACMMWRGALQRKSDGLIVAHKLRVDAGDYESVGCCGLAGKPEVT